MAISTYLSIITLNVNGQNALIKRQKVSDWIKIKKQEHTICYLQETHFMVKYRHRLKWGDGE